MALQAHIPSNSQQCISVSSSKICPKIGTYAFVSLLNWKNRSKLHLQACIAKGNQNIQRPLADFPSTPWKDADVFTSNRLPQSELESCEKQIRELKEKVKEILTASTSDVVEKVGLIYSICRLGLSYHFETEIEQQLSNIFELQPNLVDGKDYDLYTVSILFRVFRQHGYKISCDVFNKFKDDDGNFKEILTSNVRGILSLYEAAYLRTHNEDILDDALAFTKAHLKSLAAKSSPHLAKYIMKSLEMPSHKELPRYETRQYISFYEEEESKNETLLLFAKLDFNMVQLLHQQELCGCMRWWKELNLLSKLSYARDRIVEIYFFIQALYFEPCYSHARLMCTKVVMILSVLDDTYDAYGTLEELQRFTDALQRWESSAIDQFELPDYLKVLYTTFLDLFDEIRYEMMSKEGRSYGVSYTKHALKEMARAYLVEAKWFREGYVPTFEEYLNNAVDSAGSMSTTAASFIGMKEIGGPNPFDWLQHKPKIVTAAYTVGRLTNDIMSNKFEQERSHVASGVECYMKQYECSRNHAIERLKEICENAWKDMNEECMRPTTIPMKFLITLVNLARLSEVLYCKGDGYTKSEFLRDHITKLFIDKIPI